MKLSSLSNRPIARRVCVPLVTAVICFFAAKHSATQAANPADGPWTGWAQCVLTGQFTGQGQTYSNQQTHTWVLTSSTPGPPSTADIKYYAATWQVTGQGTRQRGQGNNREQWTTAGQPMPDMLTIRRTAEGTVRIGGAAQLRSVGTTTGIPLPYVEEWPFPVIEGPATQTTISGSAPQGLSPSFSGAPPGTTTTATCSWNFVRGGAAPPPPSPLSALPQVTPGGAASRTAGTLPGGVLTAAPAPTSTQTAPAPTLTATPIIPPLTVAQAPSAAPAPAPSSTTATAAPVNVTTTSPATTTASTTSPTATAGPTPTTDPNTTGAATLLSAVTGPAPTGLAVTGSGASATVSWQAAAGARSYVVTRAMSSDPTCCNTSSPTLNATSWTDTGLLWPGTYFYRVAVTYSDGRVGSADVTFTRPTPRDPTGFSATDMGDGRVALSWKEDVPGVNTYLILGPGTGPEGLQTRGYIADLRGVPFGTHEWTIASVYSPGGTLTPASSWPKASLTVGGHSGRYRVLVNSLQVNTDHQDDGLFKKDGKGDEVYVAAFVLSFDNYGQTSVANIPKTSVMGDVFGFPLRVQAGTASPTGGLRAGDIIPGNQVPTGYTGVPSRTALPLILYEGPLTDQGTPGQYVQDLYIFLSVWEFQGDDAWFGEWVNSISSGLRSSAYVSPLKDPVVQQTLSSAELKVIPGGRFPTTISPAGDPDRPIGTYPPGVCVPQDPNIIRCDRRIVLSRAIIERALTGPPLNGAPAGVLAVPLYGNQNGLGYYTLYIRVERIP